MERLLKLQKLFLLFCLVLSGSALQCLAAQIDSISINPELKVGQKFVLKITESTREFDGKKLTSESSFDYGIKITVLEKNEEGYRLEFDHRDFLFYSEEPSIAEHISHLDKGLRIILQTDEYGALEHIINWEDLRD